MGGVEGIRQGAQGRPHQAARPAQRRGAGAGLPRLFRAAGRRLRHDDRRDGEAERRVHARSAPALPAAPHLGEIQARREIPPARAQAHPRALDQQPLVAGMARPRRGRRPDAVLQGPLARTGSRTAPRNSTPASASRSCPSRSGRSPISTPCPPATRARRTPTPPAGTSISTTTSARSRASSPTRGGSPPRTTSSATSTISSATRGPRCRRCCAPARTRPSTRASANSSRSPPGQVPYLKSLGILPADFKADQTAFLLNNALAPRRAVHLLVVRRDDALGGRRLREEPARRPVERALVAIRPRLPGRRAAGRARRGMVRRRDQDAHQRHALPTTTPTPSRRSSSTSSTTTSRETSSTSRRRPAITPATRRSATSSARSWRRATPRTGAKS